MAQDARCSICRVSGGFQFECDQCFADAFVDEFCDVLGIVGPQRYRVGCGDAINQHMKRQYFFESPDLSLLLELGHISAPDVT
jgi:hypothetical protein